MKFEATVQPVHTITDEQRKALEALGITVKDHFNTRGVGEPQPAGARLTGIEAVDLDSARSMLEGVLGLTDEKGAAALDVFPA